MGVLIPNGESRNFCVELELDLPEGHPCVVNDLCSCVTTVERWKFDGNCGLLVKGTPEDREQSTVEYSTHGCHDECYNQVLEENDCPATIVNVTSRGIIVHAYPSSRGRLTDVICDLSRIGDVTVRRLADTAAIEGICDLRTVNMARLTTLERETLQFAIEDGYYERPRDADLSDLADEFGVSKSTLSQRLRSVEQKLILELAN